MDSEETIIVDSMPEATNTREEMVEMMGEEEVAKIEVEAAPVNLEVATEEAVEATEVTPEGEPSVLKVGG